MRIALFVLCYAHASFSKIEVLRPRRRRKPKLRNLSSYLGWITEPLICRICN